MINDRFRIVSLIARGGMGKVYRAEQAPLGRAVALKVLNPSYAGDSDPEFHKRFFLEASTTAKLTHPNTVSIFDYGRTDDDVYYIAMELLEGKTLHRALRESGPMEPARALHIARQVCRSLREAHGLGVIHRDLKPANVYLVRHGDESDFVKVLDFGLVKNLEDKGEDLTQTGLFMGSPKYMSPEQIRGERVDGRADVYALGVILYEMLTGKVPFDRASSVKILMAHVHEAPPPMRQSNPDVVVPPLLEQIVMKAMAKSPDERFASMDELLDALKQAAVDAGLDGGRSLAHSLSGEVVVSPTGGHRAVSSSGDSGAGASSGSGPTLTPSGSSMGPTIPVAPVAPVSIEQPAAKSKLPIAIGAVSILVLLGVGVAAFGGPGGDASSGAAGRTAPAAPSEAAARGGAAPAESAASVPVEPPAPAVVRTLVSLRSTPSGARVRVVGADGVQREYGPTPADVEWVGADAERGRQVELVFQLEGHRDFSVTRTITGETLEVGVELEPVAAARSIRPRPPRRPEGGGSGGSVGPIKGYKLDPY